MLLDFLGWKARWSQQVADLVIRNGVIYTSDDTLPFAESMAVANGRVLRVGNHSFVQVWLSSAGCFTCPFEPTSLGLCCSSMWVSAHMCFAFQMLCRSWPVMELKCWMLVGKLWFLGLLIPMCISYLVDCRFSACLMPHFQKYSFFFNLFYLFF